MADDHVPEDDGFIPGYILRNVGVPITLYRLDAGKRVPINDDEGADFVTEKVHLRFDANAVASLEDAFDGMTSRVPIIQVDPVLGDDGEPLVGPDGPIVTRKVVGYEDRVFYGLEAFQQAMEDKPVTTIRAAMAFAFRTSPETMGLRMVDGQGIDYQNAVGVAWSIAQGVDPSDAARMFKAARDAVAASKKALAAELEKTMAAASDETSDSPGNPG